MTDDQNTNQIIQTPPSGPKNWSEHPNTITYFAQTNFRGEARKFGIKRNDRPRHMYVIGKTGMGKSTMLENMIIQDIQNGEGLAVVDPHGDLVEKVIDFVPEHRLDDVIYFNPADMNFPIAFNIVEQVDDEYKNLIANGLVGVFKKIWADSWGPRLEYILINCILSLLDYPGATLLDVTRVLVDPGYRKKVIKKIKDPIVRQFWVNEYNNYSEKFRNEAIAPIQNKVGQFLSSSLIRNIVGQEHSTIDVRKEMDNGKILLMNLSKGRIGEENAALLGAMMITRIQLAAMSRVDIPETQRRDFYLYVDEFQNFSTESFASILSEARKYRLNITMAHQYIEQLSDEVKAAVFGNVGTMAAFRVGATDAEELEKEFQPTFMQEDIVKLPAFHIYMRLMIDGVASDPFSATTLPPISQPSHLKDEIIERSRARYASNKADVEYAINLWAAVDDEQVRSIKEDMEKKLARESDAQKVENADEEAAEIDAPPKRSKNGIPLPVVDPIVEQPPVFTAEVPEEVAPQSSEVNEPEVEQEHGIDFLSAFMRDAEPAQPQLQLQSQLQPEVAPVVVAPTPVAQNIPALTPAPAVASPATAPVKDEIVFLNNLVATPEPKNKVEKEGLTVDENGLQRETRIGYPAPKPKEKAQSAPRVPQAQERPKAVEPWIEQKASPAGSQASQAQAAASSGQVLSSTVDSAEKRKRKRKRKKRADGDLRTSVTNGAAGVAQSQKAAGTASAAPQAVHQPFKEAFAKAAVTRAPQAEEARSSKPVQPQQSATQPQGERDDREPRVPVGLSKTENPPVQESRPAQQQAQPQAPLPVPQNTPVQTQPQIQPAQQPQKIQPHHPQPIVPGQPVTFE